ncbi:MAG TPA: SirB2 family protein [Lacunisphaera sp.]
MNPSFYYILHVFALIVLTAHTFMALANPAPENRKRTMMITGVASLLMLISGFGLLAKVYPHQFPGWVAVKLVCWLAYSALAGLAYRKAHLRGVLSFIGLSLVLVALVMVYLKPF